MTMQTRRRRQKKKRRSKRAQRGGNVDILLRAAGLSSWTTNYGRTSRMETWNDSYARYPFNHCVETIKDHVHHHRCRSKVASTTPFLGEHLTRNQSVQTSRDVDARQRWSDQCCQWNGPQFVEKRIPIDATTYGKLKRHKKVFREVGKRRNSFKRRKEPLLQQNGSGF